MTDDESFLAPRRRLPSRPSTYVDRAGFPDLARRESVAARLRKHDPDGHDVEPFSEAEFVVIRQLAQDESLAISDPWVRRHAIAELATDGSAASLNALFLLARANPDQHIRAEALFALGRTGVLAAAPVLAAAAFRSAAIESIAARRALRELANQAGVSGVIAALSSQKQAQRVLGILDEQVEPAGAPDDSARNTARSSADAPERAIKNA